MEIMKKKIVLTQVEVYEGLKTLGEARKLFNEGESWIQGDLHTDEGYCLIGAIGKAGGRGEYIAQASLAAAIRPLNLSNYLAKWTKWSDIASDYEGVVTSYNDTRSRNYKQISAVLTKAETILRKGEIPTK